MLWSRDEQSRDKKTDKLKILSDARLLPAGKCWGVCGTVRDKIRFVASHQQQHQQG